MTLEELQQNIKEHFECEDAHIEVRNLSRYQHPMIHTGISGYQDVYQINVLVFIPVTFLIRNKLIMEAFIIGDYMPDEIEQTYRCADKYGHMCKASYKVTDLEAFNKAVKEASWNRFNQKFTDELEKLLDSE